MLPSEPHCSGNYRRSRHRAARTSRSGRPAASFPAPTAGRHAGEKYPSSRRRPHPCSRHGPSHPCSAFSRPACQGAFVLAHQQMRIRGNIAAPHRESRLTRIAIERGAGNDNLRRVARQRIQDAGQIVSESAAAPRRRHRLRRVSPASIKSQILPNWLLIALRFQIAVCRDRRLGRHFAARHFR